MVWNVQASLPVRASNARTSPGESFVNAILSLTLLPTITRFLYTTTGEAVEYCLTLAGHFKPVLRRSTTPLFPKEATFVPVAASRQIKEWWLFRKRRNFPPSRHA